MNLYNIIIFILGAYLLGSIHPGLIIGKSKGVDIRKSGSGNVGTTNVFRLLGKKWGIIVFICDTLKGWAPVFLALCITRASTVAVLTAAAVILGHTFSIFSKFKGGKGVATGLGAAVALVPIIAFIAFLEFLIIFKFTKTVSLASLISVSTVCFLTLVSDQTTVLTAFILLGTILIFYAHRANIVRLYKGTENRFGG